VREEERAAVELRKRALRKMVHSPLRGAKAEACKAEARRQLGKLS
jgi:hypothetical protein